MIQLHFKGRHIGNVTALEVKKTDREGVYALDAVFETYDMYEDEVGLPRQGTFSFGVITPEEVK